MSNKNIAIAAIVAIIVGAASFFGGTVYQKNKTETQRRSGSGGFSGQGGRIQGGQRPAQGVGQSQVGENGVFATGEIISKDDQSITVKSPEGGSKIIYFSDSTSIGKTAEGSSADLENGKQVMINGKTNPDGSLAAENIQIRPVR